MFFILPIGVDYRAKRYPMVTFTIMGLCTLLYLVQFMWEVLGDEKVVQSWVYDYLWLTPDKSYWWTYLTSMFMHGGFFHIFGNMVYLFLFGSCVEDLMGRMRYTIFYLLCGLAADYANILVSAEHFASDIPSGGASGAISGCIGGFLLLLAKNRIQFKWFLYLFFAIFTGSFRLPAWLVISFWFSSDFVSMLLSRLEVHHGGGVAFAAHVGGMAFGMGLIAIDRRRMKRSGALDWIEEQDEEPTVGVLSTRPAPRPSTAWHAADVRAQPRAQPQAVAAPASAAPVEGATIYLSWDGVNYGPYALSQILPMFKRGEIPPHASYWQQGMEDWRSADELRDPGSG